MKQPSTTLIGAFVIGALALVVAATLFFGSGALFKKRLAAVGYFQGSAAGLRVGAPVTYRGVKMGEVKSIGIRLDPDVSRSIIQVNMEFIQGTVQMHGSEERPSIPELVERGLTARLVLQSFVTGQLQVELDFRPDLHGSRLGAPAGAPEIPTVPSPYSGLAQQLESLDVATMVAAFQRTLASLDALLTSPALNKTMQDLPALIADLRHTVKVIEREATGVSAAAQRALAESAAALEKTLVSVKSLSQNLDREAAATLGAARAAAKSGNAAFEAAHDLLDPHGETVMQVRQTVDDLAATAARMRSFADRVDRDPSVLLRGR